MQILIWIIIVVGPIGDEFTLASRPGALIGSSRRQVLAPVRIIRHSSTVCPLFLSTHPRQATTPFQQADCSPLQTAASRKVQGCVSCMFDSDT